MKEEIFEAALTPEKLRQMRGEAVITGEGVSAYGPLDHSFPKARSVIHVLSIPVHVSTVSRAPTTSNQLSGMGKGKQNDPQAAR